MSPTALSGYGRLEGAVPVVHAPEAREKAGELLRLLEIGVEGLSGALGMEQPELEAMLVADTDWDEAPRENSRPYPPGLPYFTRSTQPPALVLPEQLSPVFQPRTDAAYPLAVWHELAHAFLLRREVVKTPGWLREFVPQAASAVVARRAGLPLNEHLARIEREREFTVREMQGRASAQTQMEFQNLLLALGDAMIEDFGEEFLERLIRALWKEVEVVGEERAEELVAEALGDGGRAWLEHREEF